jgi:hypothetical protein
MGRTRGVLQEAEGKPGRLRLGVAGRGGEALEQRGSTGVNDSLGVLSQLSVDEQGRRGLLCLLALGRPKRPHQERDGPRK